MPSDYTVCWQLLLCWPWDGRQTRCAQAYTVLSFAGWYSHHLLVNILLPKQFWDWCAPAANRFILHLSLSLCRLLFPLSHVLFCASFAHILDPCPMLMNETSLVKFPLVLSIYFVKWSDGGGCGVSGFVLVFWVTSEFFLFLNCRYTLHRWERRESELQAQWEELEEWYVLLWQ